MRFLAKKIFVLGLIYLTLLLSVSGQSPFPASYLGEWEGTMYIMSKGQVRDSVGILFTAASTEDPKAWTWRTQYFSEKYPMTKDYVLRLEDAENKVYLIDEGEGLVLYDYLFGNKLYGVFETGGFLLTSSYEFREDEIIFEVTSGKALSEEEKEVNNFSVLNVQRVVLTRKQE